ncbi:hypothetical protein [Nostoc sp. WHI]|uniref:hypothetical protein n=1 Tax=Nostoc sp. WHI TaxID=2650611 RepID=UPI0018C72732|nr:hypothetical protein [Nostoc sp. WHI]MBG1268394.1 hypothetical protein [Nostoc sp. WHI]
MILCFEVKSDIFSSLSETHSRSRGNAFPAERTRVRHVFDERQRKKRLRHRTKVKQAVRSFAQPHSNL